MNKRKIRGGGEYILNLDGEVIHKYPAYEQCNTDDIEHKLVFTGDQVLSDPAQRFDGYAMCKYCFK